MLEPFLPTKGAMGVGYFQDIAGEKSWETPTEGYFQDTSGERSWKTTNRGWRAMPFRPIREVDSCLPISIHKSVFQELPAVGPLSKKRLPENVGGQPLTQN